MTLTPEEALREFQKWTFFTGDTGEPTTYLASLGYRLTPIEINEAAVEKAARAAHPCEDQAWMASFNTFARKKIMQQTLAAITAYHEALFSRARGEKEVG